jgi:hypothetical protein
MRKISCENYCLLTQIINMTAAIMRAAMISVSVDGRLNILTPFAMRKSWFTSNRVGTFPRLEVRGDVILRR